MKTDYIVSRRSSWQNHQTHFYKLSVFFTEGQAKCLQEYTTLLWCSNLE